MPNKLVDLPVELGAGVVVGVDVPAAVEATADAEGLVAGAFVAPIMGEDGVALDPLAAPARESSAIGRDVAAGALTVCEAEAVALFKPEVSTACSRTVVPGAAALLLVRPAERLFLGADGVVNLEASVRVGATLVDGASPREGLRIRLCVD